MMMSRYLLLTALILFGATSVCTANSTDTIPPLVERRVLDSCTGAVEAVVTDMPDPPVRSNLASIDLLSAPGSFNYRIDVEPFEEGVAPGASYSLAVIDRTKDARAIVRIYDKAGNGTLDTVTYTAIDVAAEPKLLSFGSFFTGASWTKSITLENRSFRRVRIIALRLLKENAGFALVDPSTGFELDSGGLAGARREVSIRFDATVAGRHFDSLGVETECGLRYYAEVNAAVGTPIIEVTDHDFGTWPISAPPSVNQIEIRNISTDGGVLTVSGIARDIGDTVTFTLPDGLPAFPLSLVPGESRVLRVASNPEATATYTDSIVFAHNAPPNPLNDSVGVLIVSGFRGNLGVTGNGRDGELATMTLRPNPAGGDEVLVALDGVGTSTIRLTTLTGEILRTLESPAGANVTRLDLRGLATGSYLVSLTSRGRREVRRLVIER